MVRRNPLKALMIAVGVMVIGAGIALVVVDGDSSPSTVRAAAPTSTSTTTTPEETTTTASTTTTTAVPPTTQATTTTRRPAATPTTANPGSVRAPAAGTYRYVQDGTGDGGPSRREYTMTITAAPDEGGAARRNVAVDNKPDDEQAWAADAVRSLRQTNPSAPCTWNPPRTLYVGTLTVGATWSIDSSCAKTTVQYPQTNRHQGQYRVTGREGANVVIHFTERHSVTENNGQTTELQTTEGDIRFDPQRGLLVRRQETMRTVDQPQPRAYDTRLL